MDVPDFILEIHSLATHTFFFLKSNVIKLNKYTLGTINNMYFYYLNKWEKWVSLNKTKK